MRTSHLVGSLVTVLAVAACASVRTTSRAAAIGSVAASANAALDSGYRHGNAAAAVALMTDSVVISAEGVPDLHGRTAVRELLAQFFAGNRVEAFTLQASEVEIFGDRAFERGTFVWAAGPKGGAVTRRNGRYSILRVRGSDGAWRIHRYLENCLPAPCP